MTRGARRIEQAFVTFLHATGSMLKETSFMQKILSFSAIHLSASAQNQLKISPCCFTEMICLQSSSHLKSIASSLAPKLCSLAYLTRARYHTASLLLLKGKKNWTRTRCHEPSLDPFVFIWGAIVIYWENGEAPGRSSLIQKQSMERALSTASECFTCKEEAVERIYIHVDSWWRKVVVSRARWC